MSKIITCEQVADGHPDIMFRKRKRDMFCNRKKECGFIGNMLRL